MKLYKLDVANFNAFFGTDKATRMASKQDITMVAQFPDCSSYLLTVESRVI